jgi:hypothetical protein
MTYRVRPVGRDGSVKTGLGTPNALDALEMARSLRLQGFQSLITHTSPQGTRQVAESELAQIVEASAHA